MTAVLLIFTRISSRAIVGVGTSLNTNCRPYSNTLTAFMRALLGPRTSRAHLGAHGVEHDVAVEPLDLPIAQVPEVGAWSVDLRSRRLDDAGRGLQRPEEGALNRQLDRDHVAKHVDAVQLTMDIGEIPGDAEYEVA